MRLKIGSFLQTISVRIILILFGIAIPCLIFELELRIEYWIRKGRPILTNPSYRWDASLGWLGKEHLLGPASSHPILILGDSFTHGLNVSSNSMWFASLQRPFPTKRIIAYGGLGYGTLQELLVLQDYLDKKVVPEFVILQLCSNDIINNYYPLEKQSFLQRTGAPRPYFDSGLIRLMFPREFEKVLWPLISTSHFAYKYNNKWDLKLATLAAQRKIHTIEFTIEKDGFGFPLFRSGVRVTNDLIGQIQNKLGKTKLILLLIDDIEPYTAAFKRIAEKHGLPLVVPIHHHPIQADGRLPDGVHFNESGNKTIGDLFVQSALTEHQA